MEDRGSQTDSQQAGQPFRGSKLWRERGEGERKTERHREGREEGPERQATSQAVSQTKAREEGHRRQRGSETER